MAILFNEALKRGVNPMLALMAREVVTTSEVAAVLPIELVDGTSIKNPREGALPSTEFVDDAGVTTEESSAQDDVPEIQFRRIIGNFDMDKMAEGVGGSTPAEKLARQTAAKAKATWNLAMNRMYNGGHVSGHTLVSSADPFAAIDAIDYGPYLDSSRRGPGSIKYTHSGTLWQFRAPGDIDYGPAVAAATDGSYTLRSHNRSFYITVTLDVSDATGNGETMIRFTSSSKQWDGLLEQIDPARLIDPTGGNGDVFSIAMLDRLISEVKVRSNRYFMLNSLLMERFYAAYRALSAVDPQTVAIPGYNGQVPVYRGIPLLTEDNILSNETVGGTSTCSSILLTSMGVDDGFFFAAQSSGGTQGLTVDADPRDKTVMGFRIEDIPTLEGKDARRRRVKLYGAPVLRSTLAAARRRGVITTA